MGCAIGRRQFITQGTLLAAAAALAACGVAGSDFGTAPKFSSPTVLKLSDFPSLASVGGVAVLTLVNSPFAIVRTSSATFVTLSRICPHQGSVVTPVSGGFTCPNHGAQFNASGQWVGGQPTSGLHSYTTVYDATAGTLTVS